MSIPSEEQVETLAARLRYAYENDRSAGGTMHDVDMVHARYVLDLLLPAKEALERALRTCDPVCRENNHPSGIHSAYVNHVIQEALATLKEVLP